MYNNHIIKKPFKASAAIGPNLLVMFGADNETVSQATAVSSLIIGATTEMGITAADISAGAYVDVVLSGIAEVKAGGAITRGSKVTANASGQAVAAAPAAGTNNQIAGIALRSAASGDIIPVLLLQGTIQG